MKIRRPKGGRHALETRFGTASLISSHSKKFCSAENESETFVARAYFKQRLGQLSLGQIVLAIASQ